MRLFVATFLLILWVSSVDGQGPIPEPTPGPNVRLKAVSSVSSTSRPSPPSVACIGPPSELEIAPRPLEQITEFQKWLNEMTHERRLLLRVIPIRNTTSLFVFTGGGTGAGFPYWVRKLDFDEAPTEFDVKMQIEQVEGELSAIARSQQFLGLHRLDDKSYLVVFYYEKR